jgi:chromatin segregation and condensation protein Rec8/ScpA/Scc1 (kleisin family)
MMNSLLKQIDNHFLEQEQLTFTQLIPSEDRQGKVLTFIPLLHLTNERRVDLAQEASFTEIYIELLDSSPVVYSEEAPSVSA